MCIWTQADHVTTQCAWVVAGRVVMSSVLTGVSVRAVADSSVRGFTGTGWAVGLASCVARGDDARGWMLDDKNILAILGCQRAQAAGPSHIYIIIYNICSPYYAAITRQCHV